MPNQIPELADRRAMREPPGGSPIMYQSWGKLLFLHWTIPVEALRPLIPRRLAIDTFEGQAWIAVTPFTVWNARPAFVPPIPWVSNFHEINVRTYVHLEGAPGVWFFSLDANSSVAVMGARAAFSLPYFHANITLDKRDRTIEYHSSRVGDTSQAEFRGTWTVGNDLAPAEPGSLEFFLIERYCLYTSHEDKLYRCRIHHQPWPLQQAHVASCQSSMIEADCLPTPQGEPLRHCGGPVNVAVWPLEEV